MPWDPLSSPPLSSAQKNTLIVLLSICPYVHIKAFCERRVWKLCKFPHLFAMNYTDIWDIRDIRTYGHMDIWTKGQ